MNNNPFKTSEEFLYGQSGGAARVIDVEAARQEAELPDFSADMGEEERQRKIEAVRKRRLNLARAAAQMVFSKDIDLMDDESRAGLYRASTKALFGFEDTDGRVAFGKKAGNMKSNLERLRLFLKGDVSQIEDEDVAAWRKLHGADEETRFLHADAHLKGKGSRDWDNGPSVVELAGAGMPGAQFGNFMQNAAAPTKDAATRKMRYETMNDEEKAAFRADTIARYERQIASANPLSMFLKTSAGISDEAAWILAKCFQNGNVDVKDIEAIGDEREREKVLTALSMMRGDKKIGHLLGFIPQDFEDGTDFGNRLQMNIYGIQQAFAGLVTDVWDLGKAGIDELKIYAKGLKDAEEAREMRKRTDLEAQIAAALRQKLPDADSFMGALSQGVAENVHWIVPYVGPFSAIDKGKAAVKGVKALKGALAMDEVGKAAKGVKAAVKGVAVAKSEAGLARQMAALELYTERLRELSATAEAALKAMPEATQALAKTGVAAKGRAMIAAGRTAAFSSFANEYIETADAEGISRAESVPSAVFVGVINQAIEQLNVPGLDRTITPAELKSLALRSAVEAFRHERSVGLRKWVADSVAIRGREMVRTVATEALTEEPLQQFTTQMALEVNKTIDELKKEGKADLANVFGELWGKIGADNFGKAWRLYFDTVQESLPAAVGFGVTGVAMQRGRQMWRNRKERKISGDMNYDEGIVDVLQRERSVRKMMAAHWMKDGGKMEEAQNAVNEMISSARAAYSKRKAGDDTVRLVANAARVDRKTAEVLHDYLEIEESMALYSPRFRAEVNLADAVVNIDEKKLKAVLPEYVEGSFLADKEKGLYSARLNLPNGEEKTLVYRVGDMSQWIDEQIGEGGLADGGELADSYEARRREMPEGAMKPWSELSDAERRDIALQKTDGFLSGRAGVFEFRGADGQKVTVRADDVISLASGRIADVGYVGAQATGRTLRHEMFHALWRFAKGTLSREDIEALYSHFPDLDPAAASDRQLDERMAVEFERYASGNFVPMKVRGVLDRFSGWAMDKLGKLLDAVGVRREGVTDPVTGKAYTLSDFYNKVLNGELGSGELGVEKRVVSGGASGQESGVSANPSHSSMNAPPGEVTEDELAAVRAKDEAEMRKAATSVNGDTRFSINPNLRTDVEEALNTDRNSGKVKKGEMRVDFCRAPAVFSAMGISQGKIYSKVYILRKIAKEHNLTAEQIASAPTLIERPAVVFDDHGKGYIFLTQAVAMDEDGRLAPVMFYLREDAEGNFIASAYARKEKAESKYVNLVNAGKVLYYDKNKVTRLPLRGEAQSSLNTFNAGDNVITPERVTGSNISKFSDSVNGDTRFSISSADDAKYLDAVKRGDMETAQKMVREAAERAGYEVFAFHGTKGEFTVFDKKRIGTANDEGWLGRGFYFWDKGNRRYAEQYANGGRVMEVMLSMQEPYLIEQSEMDRLIDAADKHDVKTLEDFSEQLKNDGYDSVIDGDGQMLVFEPNQIKSADPVTYDDAGNVIPLSQRFNPQTKDIRYSVSAQREYDEVVARYTNEDGTKKPGWMKAPNGKPTNLTERQWVQVRTPSFKRWFGDWETVAIKQEWISVRNPEEIKNLQTQDVSHFQPIKDKSEMIDLFKAFGEVKNASDGRVVRFPSKSAGKMIFKKNYASAFKMLFESSLQAFVENEAKYDGHKQHPNVKAYRHYVNKFTDGIGTYYIRFTVRDDSNGSLVHGAEISDIEIYNENRATQFGNQTDGKPILNNGNKPFVDNKIAYYLSEVNPATVSKVVDENGEPLVAYHGSNSIFTEFETEGTPGTKTQGTGAFFTNKRKVAVGYSSSVDNVSKSDFDELEEWGEAYGGGVYPVFLNIKKPLSIECNDNNWDDIYGERWQVFNENDEVVFFSAFEDECQEYCNKHEDGSLRIEENTLTTSTDDVIRNEVRNTEFDGAIFKDIVDNKDDSIASSDVYVILNPNQVKSATDNTGAFDSTNPDIRYSIGGVYTGSAADYEKPSLHYVGTGEGNQVYGWGLYASSERGVAEGYARKSVDTEPLLDGRPFSSTDTRIYLALKTAGSVDGAIALLNGEPRGLRYAKWIEDNRNRISISGPSGNVYEQTFFTNRAPGDESHLLKWYEPVSEEQLGWIMAQAEKEGLVDKFENNKRWLNFKGSFKQYILDNGSAAADVYEQLSNSGIAHSDNKYRDTSEFLARAGIDGVKYPVDSYAKSVKDGDKAGWNYVSFRDDNIRVDHKWIDGEQRFSIRTRAYNPEAQVAVVDGTAEPDLKNLTTAEIRSYIRDRYMGREITIDSDGTLVEFTGENLNAAMKKRGKHRRVFHAIDALVKNAHYTRFEPNDGQAKHAHLIGQFVYTAAIRLRDGVFGVELKLDIPKTDPEKTRFKGQTLKTKIADAVLSVGPHFEKPLPTSDYETSAAETVRLGDIVSTPQIISQNGGDAQARFSMRNTQFQPARRASMAFAYPNLAWMSNEELLSAAVAAKMALGKSDKVSDRTTTVNEVQRKLQAIHPDWDSTKVSVEAQRILGDARKLSKEIRGDIDKGVSDSLILEHLPQSMRTVFGEEMTGEARRGWRLGMFQAKAEAAVKRKVAEAQERLMRDALEIETGMMHGDIERAFGVDLAATLLKVKENEYLKITPKSSGSEAFVAPREVETMGESVAEDAFSADETVEEVKPKVSALVQAISERAEAKAEEEREKRKKNRERAKNRVTNEDINDGKDAEPDTGDFAGGEISPEEVVEEAVKAGVDLNNPLSFALFVMEMARESWVKKHNLKPDAEPKHSLVYIQFQRKTLQDVYTTLARRVTYSRGRETVMNALQRLDKVTTMRGLIRQAEFMGKLVNAKMIRESAQAMCERLDNLLRTEFQTGRQFKPDEESLNRKVPAMLERQARYMRHAMWLTPDGVSKETRFLLQEKALVGSEFDLHGADKSVSRVIDEADMKLKILADWGALKYKDLATVEAAVQWWLNAAEGGADAIAQAWDVREARTLKAAGVLAKAVRNPKRKTAVDGKSWTQTANEIFQGHFLFHHVLTDLTRFAGEEDRAAAMRYIDWLDLEIQKAGTRVASERIKMQDEMRKAVEQIYGRKFRDVVSELNKVDESFAPFMGAADDGVRVLGTKGRAMQLLVSLQQIGYAVEVEDLENPGQMKLAYMGGYYDNIVENGRVGQAEELLKLMSPADLNFIKWLRQWYERNRKGISEVSERIFGVGVMAELGNYMPVKMLLDPKGLENGSGATWQIFPKALTPRVRNNRDFDTSVDILTMWSSRLEESIQWKHHVELGIELRGIFGRSELQKAIRANHGAKVLSLVKGFITDILNGKGEKQEMMVNPMLDRARQFAALGGLGGNVGVMLKQITSIPAFGFEIGVWRTFRHFLGTLTPQGYADVKKVAKSEEFRNRWHDGYSEEVQNALSSENPRLLMRLWMKSMFTNKLGDCVPALLIGHGIYRDGIEQGLSEQDAMARMWMIVERTQQSSRIENRTAFQRRNALGNAIYQFLSTQNQMLNYEVRALRDAVADPKNPKKWGKFVRDATLVHFVLSTFYYWMGELYKKMLGQEPSEDQLKDWVVSMIVGPVGALYGVGTTTVDAVESWVKGYSYGSSNAVPALNWLGQVVVRDPAILIHDIFNGKKSWDDVCDDMLRWLSDFNATFRDARKFYRFQIKGEEQK